MAAALSTVCDFHKYGHCRYGVTCRYLHFTTICESDSCEIKSCANRHPRKCRFWTQFGRCKFGSYCSFKHDVTKEVKEIAHLRNEYERLKSLFDQMRCELDTLKSNKNIESTLPLTADYSSCSNDQFIPQVDGALNDDETTAEEDVDSEMMATMVSSDAHDVSTLDIVSSGVNIQELTTITFGYWDGYYESTSNDAGKHILDKLKKSFNDNNVEECDLVAIISEVVPVDGQPFGLFRTK